MYNQYFGLQRAPFKITPDTRMFFRGAGRGEILDALVYAVTSGEGIIKVVGEVGTGKTMICRMLEDCMPPNVELVYLANPSLSPEDILHAVALEMRIPLDPAVNRFQVLHALQARLLARTIHECGSSGAHGTDFACFVCSTGRRVGDQTVVAGLD